MPKVVKDFERPRRDLVEKFFPLGVATVYEAMGKVGLMDRHIKPVGEGMKLVGPALTVHLPEGDNLMEHRALTFAKRGDVLIVAMDGLTGGTWGRLFTTMAIKIGLAGVVTDGLVRDIHYVRSIRFPCFARGVSPEGSTKKQLGSINTSVSCGDVNVTPGDIVIGDDDGVVVVPKERGEWALKVSLEREAREKTFSNSMRAGRSTFELLGLADVYAKLEDEEDR